MLDLWCNGAIYACKFKLTVLIRPSLDYEYHSVLGLFVDHFIFICGFFLFIYFCLFFQSKAFIVLFIDLKFWTFFLSAFWSFVWFVGFCFLANQWQVAKPEDNPLKEGGDAARAAITFAFFSIFTWVCTENISILVTRIGHLE